MRFFTITTQIGERSARTTRAADVRVLQKKLIDAAASAMNEMNPDERVVLTMILSRSEAE